MTPEDCWNVESSFSIVNVLSLLNFTAIYWIWRCMAVILLWPNTLAFNVNENEKWLLHTPHNLDPLQILMGSSLARAALSHQVSSQ